MFLLVILVFVALTLVGYAASGYAVERQQAKESLDRRLSSMAGVAPTSLSSSSVMKDRRLSGIGALNTVLARVSLVGGLVKMIRQAGLKRRVGEVVLYIPLLALAAFLFTLLLGLPKIFGLVAGVVAGWIPIVVISRMRSRRLARFSEQLPDALDLMTSALRAGLSFPAALQLVAQESPEPLAQEFAVTFDEQNLGLDMKEALVNLTERVESVDLRFFVTAVIIQRETGGNLAEIMESIARIIRERFRILGDVKSRTAHGRFTGLVLSILPVGLGLVIFMIAPAYMMGFFHDPAGKYMLLACVVLQIMGYIWIRKVIQIKV